MYNVAQKSSVTILQKLVQFFQIKLVFLMLSS